MGLLKLSMGVLLFLASVVFWAWADPTQITYGGISLPGTENLLVLIFPKGEGVCAFKLKQYIAIRE